MVFAEALPEFWQTMLGRAHYALCSAAESEMYVVGGRAPSSESQVVNRAQVVNIGQVVKTPSKPV